MSVAALSRPLRCVCRRSAVARFPTLSSVFLFCLSSSRSPSKSHVRHCFQIHPPLRMKSLWTRGPSTDKNKALVEQLRSSGVIKSHKVAEVMETIDRGLFLSDGDSAYIDSPIPIGYNATISAPHMHAICLELLKDHLQPGMHALDVGSGTGYLTACFAMMVGSQGRAVGVEHIPELVASSVECIRKSAASTLLENGSLSVLVAASWKTSKMQFLSQTQISACITTHLLSPKHWRKEESPCEESQDRRHSRFVHCLASPLMAAVLALSSPYLITPSASLAQPIPKGAELFRKACIGCHDMGGNILQPGATLFANDLQRNGFATEDRIYNITYYGKGRMPGFGEKCSPRGQCTFGPRLQEDEIRMLAEFVKSQADVGWPNIEIFQD